MLATNILLFFLIISFFGFVFCNNDSMGLTDVSPTKRQFKIFSFDLEHVQAPFTVTIWILVASIAKILFHVNKKFGDALPDSACLIVVGLIVGFILVRINVDRALFHLDATSFFLYLLPPIIFDAGYFMPNRQLFDNLDSVMVFAFIGTSFNTLAMATTLYVCGSYGLFSVEFSLFEILLFSSLISAVDPVAVIAVFQEVNVNEFLFINVFGEALFNDGAAVVLYYMFKKFNYIGIENLNPVDYIAGGASFFVIVFGGIFIGIFFAVVCSFVTKYTDSVKILAPVLIFTFPYLAYLMAEMIGVSAIFAIVVCGIVMKGYVKRNISQEANTSVKYLTKLLSQSSETIIFMFLGLSTLSSSHHWNTAFVLITIASCLFFRTIGVIFQCKILYKFRGKKFTFVDQCVLSYGGLRGAIAFGLVVSMPEIIEAKSMFITTTIAVIYFTVFFQGITIRYLLNWLKVKKAANEAERQELMLFENIYNRYFDFTMAGIEDITGRKGRNSMRRMYEHLNARIIKPVLLKSFQRQTFDESKIVRFYQQIVLQEEMDLMKQGRRPYPFPLTLSAESKFDDSKTDLSQIILDESEKPEKDDTLEMFNKLL